MTKKPTPNNNTKYGLFCYDTNNIGDEIQSIAARQFLPQIDYFINRDNIDNIESSANEKIKIIMNGWFISPYKKDGLIHWPPKNNNLIPLLISMHIDSINQTTKIFASKTSQAFLKSHSPIGTRNIHSYEFLQSLSIDSYFSGCLTLTLIPDKNIKKDNFILAIDVSDNVYNKIKSITNRRIIRIDAAHKTTLERDEKFAVAEFWLYLYQSAHCVISQRLHAILPCLALGTPVIGITGRDPKRYSGLIDLANHLSEEDFLKKDDIDLENPPKNPNKHLALRKKLTKKCCEFTNHAPSESFLYNKTVNELLREPALYSALAKGVGDADKLEILQGVEAKLNKDIANKNNLLQEKDREINNLQNVIKDLEIKLSDAKNPGVKQATKTMLKSYKKYINKRMRKK